MRSAAIEPLANVSMATMPSLPLFGASVATHITGMRARAARRIHGRSFCGRLGKVIIPSTFAAMAAANASSSPSPSLG